MSAPTSRKGRCPGRWSSGTVLVAFSPWGLRRAHPTPSGQWVRSMAYHFLRALTDPKTRAANLTPLADQMKTMLGALSPAELDAQAGATALAQVPDTAHMMRVTALVSASHPPTVARAVAEMMTTERRNLGAAIQAPVPVIASAMGAPGERLTQTVDRDKAHVSKARDGDVMAATRARHVVMPDDPAFLHGELDRFLVTRAAARVGR